MLGFDKLMPEKRPWPYKYFPKFGVNLGVAFGDPISPCKFSVLDALHHNRDTIGRACNSLDYSSIPHRFSDVRDIGKGSCDGIASTHNHGTRCIADSTMTVDHIRSEVTAVIQRAVEDWGRIVSGNNLDRPFVRSQPNQ